MNIKYIEVLIASSEVSSFEKTLKVLIDNNASTYVLTEFIESFKSTFANPSSKTVMIIDNTVIDEKKVLWRKEDEVKGFDSNGCSGCGFCSEKITVVHFPKIPISKLSTNGNLLCKGCVICTPTQTVDNYDLLPLELQSYIMLNDMFDEDN